MCSRFILVQKLETIEKRFQVTATGIDHKACYNIGPGMNSLVVTNDNRRILQHFRFGLTPHWATKNMLLINARTEGDKNTENDINYHGSKDIINKPAFRKAIRSQRCLVIADAFIEGSTEKGLTDAHLVFLRNKVRPFAFAGIWDIWKNPETGEITKGFAIITTVANSLMQQIPHHRSPVILEPWQESVWLNSDTPLSDITAMLKPYSSDKMNAYKIGPEIKKLQNNYAELLNPIGNNLIDESEVQIKESLYRQGFGGKSRN